MNLSRRNLLRFGALTGAAVAAPSLAGCRTQGTAGPADPGAAAADVLPTFQQYTGVTADVPGEPGRYSDLFYRYPEPVKAISEVPGDGGDVTCLTVASVAPPPLESNPFWQAFNERLGINYVPTLTPSPDYPSKFATMTAGDELPDLFTIVVDQTAALDQLLAAKAADLTDHLAGDAILDYPFLANLPTISWQETIFGGRIRAIPIVRGYMTSLMMYSRKDLLAEQGITEEPGSFEEWYAALEEMNAPSANTWALASIPTDFVRQMLRLPNKWYLDGDRIVTAYAAEGQEEALESMRRIVEAGMVNPDAATASESDQRAWFQNGSASYGWWTMSSYPALAVDPTGEQDAYIGDGVPVPGYESGTGTPFLGEPNVTLTGFNAASAERIETLLSIANYLAAPYGTEEYLFRKYGLEGEHFTMTDGEITQDQDRGGERGIGHNYICDSPWVIAATPETRDAMQRWQDFEKVFTEEFALDPTTGLYSSTASRSLASLNQTMRALELDIVLGRQPVSAWAEGVEKFRADGGTLIEDELTQSYAEANA
ncbi:substrate-binding domain-containing protein [Ruania suaedae]|uniref:substrate-binding domain-containing protein n=1 Tax=Ruania suaedae TaxID=2897774 RepID=UPI001E4BFC51|nr:substrate-binding domain-containing protein [Ruania suaedae]UFU03119.1 substrate-binding domain-containing protein [Ruania suaedae]